MYIIKKLDIQSEGGRGDFMHLCVLCEAIFRVEGYFFVGAHNSIYFVNIKLFSPYSTLTTPQKGKK